MALKLYLLSGFTLFISSAAIYSSLRQSPAYAAFTFSSLCVYQIINFSCFVIFSYSLTFIVIILYHLMRIMSIIFYIFFDKFFTNARVLLSIARVRFRAFSRSPLLNNFSAVKMFLRNRSSVFSYKTYHSLRALFQAVFSLPR